MLQQLKLRIFSQEQLTRTSVHLQLRRWLFVFKYCTLNGMVGQQCASCLLNEFSLSFVPPEAFCILICYHINIMYTLKKIVRSTISSFIIQEIYIENPKQQAGYCIQVVIQPLCAQINLIAGKGVSCSQGSYSTWNYYIPTTQLMLVVHTRNLEVSKGYYTQARIFYCFINIVFQKCFFFPINLT